MTDRVRYGSWLVLLAAGTSAAAQPPDLTVRLNVRPAAEPVPALAYELLPPLADRTPGNAALVYYRAFSPEWLFHRRERAFYEHLDDYLKKPPAALPAALPGWVRDYRPLKELDLAARRQDCNWELTERARQEGISMLLPDMQGFRDLAKLLALRARLEIAEGRFDQAAYTLQTGFALARDISRNHILIADLVGMAIANLMLDQVETLVQQPGAPNMYWALTELPRPFVNLRDSFEGDQLFLTALLPSIQELEAGPMPEATLRELMRKVVATLQLAESSSKPVSLKDQLLAAGLVVRAFPQAKHYLATHGRARAQIEALPPIQVVLLYSVIQYRRLRDDLYKWATLPYWEALPGLRQADRAIRDARREWSEGLPFGSIFLPALSKVVLAQARLDRRVAALRCVEALRLHAAAHGELPGRLRDVTEVPIPLDPVTGKDFGYRAGDGKATIEGPAPAGEEGRGGTNTLRYEVTLRP